MSALLPSRTATSLCLLFVLGASLPASPAQEPSAAMSTADDADRALERTRVFHLHTGEPLRVRSRWSEGTWEIRPARDWTPLDPATVARWDDERALLAEARKLEGRLAAGGDAGRVELAAWLLAQYLLPESLDQLDRVLRADPDHVAARELLAQHPRMPELPPREAIVADAGERLTEILKLGTAAGPARQELVIRELGDVYGAKNLGQVFEHALRTGSDRRRAFATLALRRLMPGGALRELYRRAALDPVEDVRRGAAYAIRDVGVSQPGLILPLTRALESPNGAVRTNAAESLGHMGLAAAEPFLRAHLARVGKAPAGAAAQGIPGAGGMSGSLSVSREFAYVLDFDVEIAQAASIADPIIGHGTEGVFLDVRLGGVYQVSVARELRTVRWALERVTPEEQ